METLLAWVFIQNQTDTVSSKVGTPPPPFSEGNHPLSEANLKSYPLFTNLSFSLIYINVNNF